MDQQKIGQFLKQLRHDKGLTQEQLAEQFNISRRTVSRWETGSNMPDLSLLIELADLYDVDLRELLDGRRKEPDSVPDDPNETAVMIADKATDDHTAMTARFHLIFISGAVCFILYIILLFAEPDVTAAWYDALRGFLVGISLGTVLLGVIMTHKDANRLREAKQRLFEKARKKDNTDRAGI
ncbi:MAG: helix-turn-helix transcriptional regulator [Oscillospiraceae bacterium]|nr:helix-turn-helix transcriptional regulator [Oscillospiraceae bacterium]